MVGDRSDVRRLGGMFLSGELQIRAVAKPRSIDVFIELYVAHQGGVMTTTGLADATALQSALDSRVVIDQAAGCVAHRYGVGIDELR